MIQHGSDSKQPQAQSSVDKLPSIIASPHPIVYPIPSHNFKPGAWAPYFLFKIYLHDWPLLAPRYYLPLIASYIAPQCHIHLRWFISLRKPNTRCNWKRQRDIVQLIVSATKTSTPSRMQPVSRCQLWDNYVGANSIGAKEASSKGGFSPLRRLPASASWHAVRSHFGRGYSAVLQGPQSCQLDYRAYRPIYVFFWLFPKSWKTSQHLNLSKVKSRLSRLGSTWTFILNAVPCHFWLFLVLF